MILWFYIICLKAKKFFSHMSREPVSAIMVKMNKIVVYLRIVKIRVQIRI